MLKKRYKNLASIHSAERSIRLRLGGVQDFPASVSLTCCFLENMEETENRPPHHHQAYGLDNFLENAEIYVTKTGEFLQYLNFPSP